MLPEHLDGLGSKAVPEPRPLSRAPIKEALVDFRVKSRADVVPEDFAGLRELLRHRFPKAGNQQMGQMTITLSPTGPLKPTIQQAPLGLVFQNADDTLLAQFRVDGFTLNRLRPYSSWEELRPIALDLWNLYCDVAKPTRLVRLALRFINELALPRGPWEFSEYLRAAPSTPEEVPQDIAAFVSRVTAVEAETRNAVHIAQRLGQEESGPVYVLDIDAFRDGDWSPSDASVPKVLDDLRRLKNLVFFNMLTERTLSLFE